MAKLNNTQITIHEDKYFDFFYETDFVNVLQYYLEASDFKPLPKTVNLCYREKYKLSEIAAKIVPIENICVLSNSNNHYSGNCDLLYSMGIPINDFEMGLIYYNISYNKKL